MSNIRIGLLDVCGFKGIVSARVEPGERYLLRIAGKNAQGKTSLIDAISCALGGKKEIPPDAVRHGEPFADIHVTLFDGDQCKYVVSRRIYPDGKTKLVVKDADGKTLKRSQEVLDEMIGARFLDPLAFTRLTEKEQAATLLKLVDIGLDLLEHECQRRIVYTERSGWNEDKKKLKVKMEEAEDSTPILDEIDPSEVSHKLTKIIEKMAGQEAESKELEHTMDTLEEREAELARIEARALELRPEILHLSAERERLAALYDGHVPLEDLTREKAEAEDRVHVASEMNAERAVLIEQRRVREAMAGEFRSAERESERCTAKLKAFDAKKAAALASASMPVEGLGFADGHVTYNDVPLKNASGAEQLRVSLAIACAMSAKLRDICITDGALLDEDSLRIVGEFAEEHGLCLWVERVGENEEGAIIISAGEVVERAAEAA